MTCRALAGSFAILFVCSAALCREAIAQTTQPVVNVLPDEPPAAPRVLPPAAPPAAAAGSWAGVVQDLVSHLAAGRVESAWILMGPRARIDEFDPDAPATFARLVDLAKRATLLGVHPYETAPTRLAEDIAADVREAASVPQELRRRMTPSDEDEAARANATAAQWLAQNLNAEKGQPLATVVLWDATESQLVFILLKGQRTASTQAFHVTHVVFGNPLTVPR